MDIRLACENDLQKTIELSKEFVEENCCNAICVNKIEDLKKSVVVVATEKSQIIGYAYGNFEKAVKNRQFVNKGDKVFSLEEMYVKKEFRNKSVGKKLFEFLEQRAKSEECVIIELNAVSKNYEKLLKFYVEEVGATFWSAFLFKKI